MIKKTIYPKTKRIGGSNNSIIITEKLDGSNLGFFKLNGELIIAQRNWVFKRDELNKNNSYKGLIGWLDQYGDKLLESLQEKAGVFGEWIGMGRLNYGNTLDPHRYHIFAKANIDEDLDVKNIYYNHDLFIYPFVDQVIPEFLTTVNIVKRMGGIPSLDQLNELFINTEKEYGREIEGFIINNNDVVTKYVRRKSGQLLDHIE